MHSPVRTLAPRLADLTTLRLGGPARDGVTVTAADQLVEALSADRVLVIGGGSNLVVADEGIDATVVAIAIPGVDVDGDRVRIGAGENWDGVVERLVAEGFCGIAALSGIPGSAGATPVQNVGAYGTEIAELLAEVTLFDRETNKLTKVSAADLGLAYRSSILRGTDKAVIVDLTLRLGREPQPVRYAELARTLGVAVGETAPDVAIREAVLHLRRSKGMVLDPADSESRSAGSFFTNPILTAEQLAVTDAAIRARLGDEVSYPNYPAGATAGATAAGTATKLSAAWLIERAGITKGYPGPGGRVRVSEKHTLALVNRGGTTADLLALAKEIRDTVETAFAVRLHPEPVLVGVTLDG